GPHGLPMPFGDEPEKILTDHRVGGMAEQVIVGRAGVDDPKIAVQDDDPLWRGADPGGENIEAQALRVAAPPRRLYDAAPDTFPLSLNSQFPSAGLGPLARRSTCMARRLSTCSSHRSC